MRPSRALDDPFQSQGKPDGRARASERSVEIVVAAASRDRFAPGRPVYGEEEAGVIGARCRLRDVDRHPASLSVRDRGGRAAKAISFCTEAIERRALRREIPLEKAPHARRPGRLGQTPLADRGRERAGRRTHHLGRQHRLERSDGREDDVRP